MDDRKQASEAIKDLMVNERRSKLPLILTVLVVMALLAGVGYLYSLPPEKRPTFDEVKGRVMALANSILNAPIANKTPTPAPNVSSPTNNKAAPASKSDASGLLSN
jgi:hypothetical protein